MRFKYDWGSIIVDFVKKKDLDCDDFADCWTEDYDWTKFDLYLIENYYEDLVSWGVTRFNITPKESGTDLRKYEANTMKNLEKIDRELYCISCNKTFKHEQDKKFSNSIPCPKCKSSKEVVGKGHPLYPKPDVTN